MMIGNMPDISAAFLLSNAAELLPNSQTPRLDAEIILSHILGIERSELLLREVCPGEAETSAFGKLIERRRRGEPVAYLTGKKDFYKHTFAVNSSVLIPRPETEGVIEAVLARYRNVEALSLLDIGTGSGCIAVSIAVERPKWRVVGSDISSAALETARGNASLLSASNVEFVESDLFSAISGKFDVIVSNPPYVPSSDEKNIMPDVREYEPHGALFAGDDGLSVIRRILAVAPGHLHRDGMLFCEIGFGQRDDVETLIANAQGDDWSGYSFIQDLSGTDRILAVQRSGKNGRA